MKEKIITLVACLLFVAANLSAKSLVLTLKNGTLVYYLLDEEVRPMLRFVDGGIMVNTDKYEFSNVKNFYISATDDPSSIEHATGNQIEYSRNMLVINAEYSLSFAIYTSSGHKVSVPAQQVNGQIIIDLNPLPQGAYVVTIGESSLKVLKK